MMGLTSERVKEYCINAGAETAGIAAAADFCDAPEGFKPDDVLPECKSVIVLGASFPSGVLDDIDEYTASRNEMTSRMTEVAQNVAKKIKAAGYMSKAISAIGGKMFDTESSGKEYRGAISLKHAAVLAGLGIIGKNYLLTSPEYGNLIWLSAVLTDAELSPDKKIQYDMCGGCNKCVEACPAGSLDDISSFGKKGCAQYFKMEDKKLRIKCYTCRTVCPHMLGFSK